MKPVPDEGGYEGDKRFCPINKCKNQSSKKQERNRKRTTLLSFFHGTNKISANIQFDTVLIDLVHLCNLTPRTLII